MQIAEMPKPIATGEISADLIEGLQELKQSGFQYAQANSYYEGSQPEFFGSLRLRIAMGSTGVIFNYNFAKLAVTAVAERLEISSVTSTDQSAAAIIEETWTRNRLDLHAPHTMLMACEYGDAYILAWPGDMPSPSESEDTPDEQPPSVQLFYNSPRAMRIIYADENELIKRYAIKRWQDSRSGYTFVNLYYADRIEKYMQAPLSEKEPKPVWKLRIDEEGEQWPLPNPYGEIPVFHFRNGFPYGTPEHKDGYGPQDSIHKLVINHMASVDYNAFPQRYALVEEGYDTSEAAFGDEGKYSFALATGATADVGVDAKSQLTADPASVWFMKGVKSYGQFDPGSPEAFMRLFEKYIHAMAVVTCTPMHFLDPIVANVSGESLRVVEAPFARKVRNRQVFFGSTWQDIWAFVLKVHGVTADVSVSWVPAATVNDLATLQGQLIKSQLGVPEYQLLLELGYTGEQLAAWNIPPNEPLVPRGIENEQDPLGQEEA